MLGYFPDGDDIEGDDGFSPTPGTSYIYDKQLGGWGWHFALNVREIPPRAPSLYAWISNMDLSG